MAEGEKTVTMQEIWDKLLKLEADQNGMATKLTELHSKVGEHSTQLESIEDRMVISRKR